MSHRTQLTAAQPEPAEGATVAPCRCAIVVRVFVADPALGTGLDADVVVGIDPGLTRCGYAVLRSTGNTVRAEAMGVIRTPASIPLPQRLAMLRGELAALLAQYRPGAVAVEQVFFQVNVRTAMSVGQASGLALAEAAAMGCEVAQYTPSQVKDTVAGWGGAGKEQVQRMVQARLGLAAVPEPPDAADAGALALCHLAAAPMRRRLHASILRSAAGR
jgi:crossover junction endodeoxyribonuclease RuvC